MAKIRISCKNNKMTFSLSPDKRDIDHNNLNLTQTNIINTESMIFTSNYMLKNPEIVTSFIQGIAIQRNINKVYINDKEIFSLVVLLIQSIKNFEEIYFVPDEQIEYDVYERLLYSPYIKYINCYSMKHFMIEKLDSSNDKTVEIRKEMFFLSNFMNDNELKFYSSIYYKKTLDIKNNMTELDIEDFEIFCRINKYLKTINLYYYSREVIRIVVKYLVKYKIKNISIKIYESDENNKVLLDSIEYLKLIKGELKKEYNYNFKIIYSSEYNKKNFLKQINLTNLKLSSLIIIITVSLGIITMEYNGYVSEKNINDINSLIEKEVTQISDQSSSDIIVSNDGSSYEEKPIDTTSAYNEAFKKIFGLLKEKNSDTVGWIKINNTNIEYPVVQTNDNNYYLSNDFYKNKNSYGWVFMDYRNNSSQLNQNTIIYGHNSRKKVMFTYLTNTLEKEWYLNKTNQIIIFNTPEANMEWQIFSIYTIDVTSDYLYVDFANSEKFLEFADKMKSRSINDFGVNIDKNDKILTLSTCLNSGAKRIVVHAKLTKIIPNN